MKAVKRALIGCLICVMCLWGSVSLTATATGTLYFTSINDSLLDLTSNSMPAWIGGSLYVPYTVFDRNNSAGVYLGISATYNQSTGILVFYGTIEQALVFDLNQNLIYNGVTGESFSGSGALRNGVPYVPVALVCKFFGLTYSYIGIEQGYLVRIKNDAVVLSDAKFIDAATDLMNRRVREYNQANQSTTNQTTKPPTNQPEETEEQPETVYEKEAYLGVLCGQGEYLTNILDVLSQQQVYGIFFIPAQGIEQPELIFRILGSGHTIGLYADGSTTKESLQQLQKAADWLAQQAYSQTVMVSVPKGQEQAIEAEGYLCWSEEATITEEMASNSSVGRILNTLSGKGNTVYFTIQPSQQVVTLLPNLLIQMKTQHYTFELPLETNL